LAEEKDKPLTITLKCTIPIRDIMFALKQIFPFIEVSVEEEKPTEIPSEVRTPDEHRTGTPKTPVIPPGTIIEAPTRKPEEAPPVQPEG